MSLLYYLGSRLAQVLLVFHIALDLPDGLLVSRNLYFLIQVHFLGGLLPLEIQDPAFLHVDFGLYAQARELLEYRDPVSLNSFIS